MIKLARLPPDILSRIPGVRKAPLEDKNVVFAYLSVGLPPAAAPFSDVDIAVYAANVGNLANTNLPCSTN